MFNTFPYKQPKEKKRLRSEIESCHICEVYKINEDSSEVHANIQKQSHPHKYIQPHSFRHHADTMLHKNSSKPNTCKL